MSTLLKARSQWQHPGRPQLPAGDSRQVKRQALSGQGISNALSQALRGGNEAAG